MDPFTWIVLAVLFAGSAAIKGIAGQHTAEAQAAAAETEAAGLEELGKEGGYYDQVLGALEAELADVEADRAAAAQLLSITEGELKGEIEQSFIQEKAAIAGLEAQKAGLEAQKAGQIISGLETIEAGAAAIGQRKAAAGAAGFAQTGSVLRRSEAIARTVGRRIAAQNLAIGVTGQAIGATEQAEIATRGAAVLQRGRLQNDITRAQLGYEDALRGLKTREAETLAQETMATFKKTQGIKEAEILRSEAEWLKTWGVGLSWASALTGGLTDILGIGAMPGFGDTGQTLATASMGIKTTPFRVEPWEF